jgi:hypothetical protein
VRDTTRRAVPAAHGDLDVPELSLVVVHGIGSQADGATAREWAQSAVELLTRSGTPARITDVVPPGIGAPAAYTVEVNPPGVVAGLPVVRLQFVDAYWANAFPAPGVKRVVRWLSGRGRRRPPARRAHNGPLRPRAWSVGGVPWPASSR